MCDNSESREQLVLISVDGCDHSLRAFDWYYKNFYRKDHVIGLAHIYTQPEVPSFGKHHGKDNEITDNEEYQRRYNDVLKKKATVIERYQELCDEKGMESRVMVKEKVASIGQTICDIAKENQVMCIVMGQRGLGAIKRTIYGSVSDYVLHHAHVAVLIVPPPKDHKYSKHLSR